MNLINMISASLQPSNPSTNVNKRQAFLQVLKGKAIRIILARKIAKPILQSISPLQILSLRLYSQLKPMLFGFKIKDNGLLKFRELFFGGRGRKYINIAEIGNLWRYITNGCCMFILTLCTKYFGSLKYKSWETE